MMYQTDCQTGLGENNLTLRTGQREIEEMKIIALSAHCMWKSECFLCVRTYDSVSHIMKNKSKCHLFPLFMYVCRYFFSPLGKSFVSFLSNHFSEMLAIGGFGERHRELWTYTWPYKPVKIFSIVIWHFTSGGGILVLY